jgi:small subunit ribosomal protein S4
MKTGPKYKVCRRLGSSVFTKCQTQKYTLSEERRRPPRRRRSRSNYSTQLLEKQRARFTYGVSERQFSRYVKEAIEKSGSPAQNLYQRLEERLDNVVFMLGYAKSRRMARQLVSHGHFSVNGKKLTVPSHQVKVGDKIELRDRSKDMQFANKEDAATALPAWLSVDEKNNHLAQIASAPTYNATDVNFDLTKVVEFYSR